MKNLRALLSPRFEAEKLAASTPDLKILSQRIAAHILHGPHATRKAGSGEAFWQYREYIAGDAPNSIDWRQSAKTDRIFIRQKEQYKAQRHLFWVQRNTNMDFCSNKNLLSKKQAAGVIALALALLHTRGGELIGFAEQGSAGHSERSLQNFENILFQPNDSVLPNDHIVLPKSCGIVLVGDFLSPPEEIERSLTALGRQTRNGTVIQILDPAELSLPYQGRAIFENGPARVLVNNVRDIAAEYAERIEMHNVMLKSIISKLGWHYTQYVTSHDPAALLLGLWKKSMEAQR
jgi:uncharacterized protein (DUF58 family)